MRPSARRLCSLVLADWDRTFALNDVSCQSSSLLRASRRSILSFMLVLVSKQREIASSTRLRFFGLNIFWGTRWKREQLPIPYRCLTKRMLIERENNFTEWKILLPYLELSISRFDFRISLTAGRSINRVRSEECIQSTKLDHWMTV